MKKTVLVVIALIISFTVSFAETTYKAKKVLTLTFSREDGTNASSVVWNPDKQIYYSVIAGNEDYPLETFSISGKQLFDSNAGVDVRGLWYNSKLKKLEGNCAGENGIFSCNLEKSGNPTDAKVIIKGQNQPDFQSVGAFDSKKQIIYYYKEGEFYAYKRKNGKVSKSFEMKNCPTSSDDLNTTTVIFTEIKGSELGLLDFEEQKVYLFDTKGNYSATIDLPYEASTNDFFRFSFANNKIWLYDVEDREWTGYSFK